ncbi:unnamed protein product, partial [Mesorhabditis belari]|uniref:Uncharacterized protein n=1 Tax=Mesorhabditis belari TaxID=2138241 RepID=A0AAF3JBA8_9BILA
MHVISILFLPFLLNFAICYEKYARSLEMAKPNKDGVYEFTLIVSRTLTMSYSEPPFGHRTLIDYDVEKETWYSRDPDQLTPCNKRDLLDVKNETIQSLFKEVMTLDGLHFRVLAVNGSTPGPLLVVPYGAEVLIRVHNDLMLDSFSIHFHGIDKQGLWYEDGVSFIQQCPITTMSTYDYRFFADRWGTHWYHGHLQSDRGDGLVGGFVVLKEDQSVPMDDGSREIPSRQYFILLQDWSNEDAGDTWLALKEKTMKWMYGMDQMEKCWLPTRVEDGGNVGGAIPISAILFNDKGWHNQTHIRKNPEKLPLETYRIKSNENILLRIVNGGLAQELMISIEDHNLTIVAADGNEVVPITVDKLIIFPGERYDILVKGLRNPSRKNYYVIAETVQYYFFDWSRVETMFGLANLEYENVDERITKKPKLDHPTCTKESPCSVFNCPFEQYPPGFPFKCIAVDTLESPLELEDSEVLKSEKFESGFEEHFINMHYDSHVNGFKFLIPNGMPYYYRENLDEVAINCEKTDCPKNHTKYDQRCFCFYHLKHKLNNIVQLTIYNMGMGGGMATGYAHPFHIHSTHTYLVKMGWPSYNGSGMITTMNQDLPCPSSESDCNDLKWADNGWLGGALPGMRKRASIRDTVLVPVGGYATIRFRATNPGWWIAHCHLELHMMGGAAYAFKIGDDDEIPKPPTDFPHTCGIYQRNEISQEARQLMNDRLEKEKEKTKKKTTIPPKSATETDMTGNDFA